MSDLRYCYSCYERKTLDHFTKRSNSHDGLDFYCRECKSDKNSKYYYRQTDEWKNRHKKSNNKRVRVTPEEQKERKLLLTKLRQDRFYTFINNIKSVGCCICGEKTLCCLDFHHLDPATKKREVSDMSTHKMDSVIDEIEKCICVCKNCHQKIHHDLIECPIQTIKVDSPVVSQS